MKTLAAARYPLIIISVAFSSVLLFSQQSDYKIIASNTSYLELEFYPQFYEPVNFTAGNELFTHINFKNSNSSSVRKPGEPDLKFRLLPVILPSAEKNSVNIVDIDVTEIKNINFAPVRKYSLQDPNRRDFDNIEVYYYKSPDIYSQNKFMPDEIISLENIGAVRELLTGNLIIHPYQYNPVTRILRKYTRIRVRINFGHTPVYLNRQRSRTELELLKDIGVNSNTALNWMNPVLTNQSKSPIENSKLSTGDWYMIQVIDNGTGASEGIYKMAKQFFDNAGINLNNIDPRTIKLYGNGGGLLPETVNETRPLDLVEIAIHVEGEQDGHFDPQDYILFYGKSVNNWTYNPFTQEFRHLINYYTNSNYYWVCLNTSGNGKRMQTIPSENVQNPYIANSFTEKIFYEPEINNLISEGNLWLSERKSNGQSFQWDNTLTGLEANSNVLYKIRLASHVAPPISNSYLIKEVNSTMSEIFVPLGNFNPNFGDWISSAETSFTLNASQKLPPNSEQSQFRAAFQCGSSDGEGYLDWMEIQYNRRFNSVANDLLRFTSPDTGVTIEYNISPFSNNQITIFDVTAHDSVSMMQPLNTGSNSIRFQKSHLPGFINKFITVGQNGYKAPTSISQRITNQNLRGYSEGAGFIIITHSSLLAAANRLKEIREQGGASNPNYLKTYIVTTQQIYNEFSGGLLDAVAIRDFLKYAYDNWQVRPVYVLLLGDGDIDYKNILVNDENWVPPFEHTDPNINQVNGYTSDDFYTWFTDNNPRPSLAIGRVTVRSIQEANAYIDKVECYEHPDYNGYWKNRTTYVADDGRTTGGCEGSIHTDQCERLAEYHTPSIFEKTKIYLVSYPTVITSQGRRKPDVNSDIIKYWNQGTLTLSYCGHGSPDIWAHEYVLEKEVALSQLNNRCKYTFFTVASCDFSKWDNPVAQSGGELLVTVANKGAIGSFSASRPTYTAPNEALNNLFFDNLFYYRDTLLLQMRFGKAFFNAKQREGYELNDYKYILICDPSLRIQMPRFNSNVDSITGLSNDTMRALSRIKIYGSVIHPDSSLWSDYNGRIFFKIFDVPRTISIIDECNNPFTFKINGGIIFSGTQSVRNGKWSVEYIVPKDISYLNQNGKLIDYFYNTQADGHGLYTNFIIGGIDPNAPADSVGPDIKLYLNTRNFRSGDMVNENFKLIADLFDESGINTTGTIGHKIDAVLDDNVNNKYDLTSFYNSDTTYKAGSLEYDFTSLAEGEHKLMLKAWDTYNNSSEAQIKFTVSSYSGLKVANLYNYPNPFRDNTTFTFQHNYPDAINVKIMIYTVAGRLIKELDNNNISDKFVSISWTGKDEDGETLANGIYIYKLIVLASDGKSVTEMGKLAVLK